MNEVRCKAWRCQKDAKNMSLQKLRVRFQSRDGQSKHPKDQCYNHPSPNATKNEMMLVSMTYKL